MTNLQRAIWTVAREDDAALEKVPAELVPSLTESQRALITERIIGERNVRTAGARAGAGAPSSPPALPRPSGIPLDELARRRAADPARRRVVMLGGGGALVFAAAAAAAVLWLEPSAETTAPLPGFSVLASGGLAELRGSGPRATAPEGATAATVARISDESELRVICRPENAVAGPIAVRAFLVQDDAAGEVHPRVQLAETGAADLRVSGHDLVAGRRGPARLLVVVGRPGPVGALTARAAVEHASAGDSGDGRLRWLTVPVDLAAR